jgi:hypothetical protein
MIWSYRAINNRIARRKWLSFSLVLVLIGLVYVIGRIIQTGKVVSSLTAFTFFALMVFLYTVITLGKIRYYSIDDDEIVYKPFRTKLSDIESIKVDEDNRVIRLKLKNPSPFAVRTLYFDKEDEFYDVLRFLKRKLG